MATGKKSLFCFGAGFSAKILARRLLKLDWTVYGTYREADDAAALKAMGLEPVNFEDAETELESATCIISSVPPTEDGDPVLARYEDQLKKCSPDTWIGYLSTTGVYGDTGGALVDETSPTNPSNERSRWRLLTEKQWQSLSAHIFRLAGIYGPERSSINRLRAGLTRRIDYPGHLFSRIHVNDIAQSITASIEHPNPGQIYNLCDDKPVEQQEVETYAAGLLGIDPPPLVPFEEAVKDMSPLAKTFWQDNRRVDNAKIKKELGVELLFPTYREGLEAIYKGGDGSG
jgi:nucleoside-diphosphate-sugar epimerase